MADYIERESLLKKCHWVIRSDGTRVYVCHAEDIEAAPAADVAPVRHGRMIEIIEDGAIKRISSCCGADFTTLTLLYDPAYCPHCGALLDGERSCDCR